MRTFLDTNIFLYAAGAEHPQRDACAAVLRKVAEGKLDATVNSEVLQEILHVLTRRGRREAGTSLAGYVAALFPDLLPVTRDDILEACDLVRRHRKLHVRDAVHAATMMRNGIRRIVSVDSGFDSIPEIRRLAPASV